jgi:protein kinase
MDKYKIIKTMGEGTFGNVLKAVHNETNEVFAIKKLKENMSWEEAVNLMEIKALKKLNNHPNVIKIYELIRKNENIYIVQEFCDKNLLNEMND